MFTVKLRSAMGKWQDKHNRQLTLREIERQTGISRTFLSRFARGAIRKLDLGKMGRLCHFLEVTLDDLLELNDPPPQAATD